MDPIIWVLLIIIAVIALLLVTNYNSLVVLRNRVKDQWAQIEVQLKRRFDLIPNIVETVKGYAKHETDTLESVIAARNMFQNAKTTAEEIEANNQLTGFVSKLFALSESYPELKANTNFIQMQETLQDTENKIASARQFYNDTVLSLNNKVEMFPSNIVASLFKFEKATFFEAGEEAKEAPKVKF